ncbi:MAG TPA: bifunctional salicylyl-CoA 5-hydroxylase/oxidoreductase [Planctomycetes bacterium]|nr:bifunctional salicylyl-CoA 5-hydroxylase/oxidoreductase [Planctomycetota bacterium]
MRIVSIGGGPAGLYFGFLMKKSFPDCEVDIYERNGPDDTFGWGVVFSEETLGGFEEADPESYQSILDSFAYWTDIVNVYRGTVERSTGHHFAGLARKRLLEILQGRCDDLGVRVHYHTEIADEQQFADADLILAADGINSFIREKYADHFRPSLDWRKAKFVWLGTNKPLDAFTFVFRESEHGLFQVHAYPFQVGEEPLSTWIVECHEDVWRRAGLEDASEEDTVRFVKELFAEELEGYELLTNRSMWRTFPTVKCETWHKGNICLMGDSAHTAHFSIGSGTKLAMEDAIALVRSFEELGTDDVPAVLAHYEDSRYVDVAKLQRTAQTSLEWYENSARYTGQPPVQFMFNMMTRSKRITYDNLALRDPDLVRRTTEWFAEDVGMERDSTGKAPAPLFAPLTLREITLGNRVVVSPMCQYSAQEGVPGDWHLVHLGSRAIGGAGLLMVEATAVRPDGRITPGCTGIWNDEQEEAWRRILGFCREHGSAKLGIQLAHAGRKASCSRPWEGDAPLAGEGAWPTIGPSAVPFDEGWPAPKEMDRDDMDRARDAFVDAARRAERAGFDLIELHMAHGYLLSSFLSPAANQRGDEYGGSLENRMRFPLEVFDAVRAAWPEAKPMSVRVSATDWLPAGEGTTIEDTLVFARELRERGLDVIDVSSAGNTPRSKVDYGRMYQVPFAERIKYEVEGLAVMAVGGIQGADHVNTILAAGRADLCAIARAHLANPAITLGATATYENFDFPWPKQYLAAKPRPRDDSRRT